MDLKDVRKCAWCLSLDATTRKCGRTGKVVDDALGSCPHWADFVPSVKVSVFDIIPDFGSYLSDMESNIKMDPDEWEEYQEDPSPFITDLLLDFGEFPDGVDPSSYAEAAAKRYCGQE